MAEYGVTPQGFSLKRLADIRNDLVTALNEVTDESTGEKLIVDLADADDPLVQIVDSFSDGLTVAWEQVQFAYNQFDPLKSSGGGLSGVVQLNGIRRKSGTFSTVFVSLTGQFNQFIPAGQQITDINNTHVWELSDILLDGAGLGSGIAVCTTKGPNLAIPGSLVKILTPLAGWKTVTNSVDAIGGTLEETDAELRLRQQVSTSATGASVVDALYSSLLALADVLFVRIYVNATMFVDSKGIPAKTVAVVIVGGDDEEISLTIFQKQAIGMATFGNTTTQQEDVQGIIYPIYFTRPDEINIFVLVNVTVVNESVWPDDGSDQIKAAILAYASGDTIALGIISGFDTNGYNPGDTVYASELYVPVNSVPGTQITSLLVGIASPATYQSVSVDWNEIPAFDSANINVVVS